MTDDLITVFGGSGFLGQDVIRALLARGHTVRLVARHPQRPRFDRDQEKRLHSGPVSTGTRKSGCNAAPPTSGTRRRCATPWPAAAW